MTGNPALRVHNLTATKSDAVSSSMPTCEAGSLGRDQHPAQQLLPGILDDITLDLVSTKLPSKSFYVLSAVSQGWKRAIRSGQVYDARVRAERTERVGVIDRINSDGILTLGLYWGKDTLVRKLPPIPNVRNGIPEFSKCISLDGKIYVIGGLRDWEDWNTGASDDVYMLDLARQRSWEQCESMGYGRVDFGVGVVGGKIYVLGGLSYSRASSYKWAVTVSEVYDPLNNTWNPLESMINWRSHHQVSTIGEELVIRSGYFSPKYEMEKNFVLEIDDCNDDIERADFLEIYHPGKNAWRKVTPFDGRLLVSNANVFIHEGRFHSMSTLHDIDFYDIDKKSWTSRYSYSHAGSSSALLAEHMVLAQCLDPDSDGQLSYLFSSAEVLGNELVALVFWFGKGSNSKFGQALIRSIGFGTQQQTIQWQKVECSFERSGQAKICSLEL